MSQKTSRQGLLLVLVLVLVSTPSWGFNAKKAGGELGEAIIKKFGVKGSQELAAFGGEHAVQVLLTKASAEGGEQLVGKIMSYGSKYGVQSLKVIGRAPARMVKALDRLPPGRVQQALWAVERNPEAATRLVGSRGPEAIACLVKHPGLGVELLEKFGKDGVKLSRQLSTEQVGSLLKHGDDIVKLPKATRDSVVDAIGKNTAASLAFLEKHPRVLLTGTGVGAFLALREDLLGPTPQPGPPDDPSKPPVPKGFIERLLARILNMFQTPITAILLAVVAIVLGWGGVHIWTKWRIGKLKIEREQSGPGSSLG
jgi:hypothetical protein